MGGASRVTDANTYSALDNPAGLAYVNGRSYGVSFRNLPESSSTVTGNFFDPNYATSGDLGKYAITHVGTTLSLGRGTLGVSYTLGGFIDDVTVGNNLSQNNLSVRNLRRETKAQTDFFTVAYGYRDRDLNIGYGLVVANQYAKSTESYQLFNGNTQVGTSDSDVSGNGIGIGLVAGVQKDFQNSGRPMLVGASIRTPIDLQGNGNSSAAYDRIPGKFSVGVAGRADQLTRGQEFLTWALQADYYFGGQGSKLIPRDNVLAAGAGVEYNLFRFNSRIPIRLGYMLSPGAGDGFSDRNAFTFGVGYRPNNADFTLDLNFAKASSSRAYDIALGLTYRPN